MARPHWFVGTTIFFFRHIQDNQEHHLVLVDVAKKHETCPNNKCIPMVKLNPANDSASSYAVINIRQITHQVGLVLAPELSDATKFRVISPYLVFDRDLSHSVGRLTYL